MTDVTILNLTKQTEMLWEALSIVSAGEPPIKVLISVFGEEQVKKIFSIDYKEWDETWREDEEEKSDEESDA